MNSLDWQLVFIGLAGAVMTYVLFTKRFGWNWSRFSHPGSQWLKVPTPFWLSFITLVSFAAIVFSIHALLVIHGIVKW